VKRTFKGLLGKRMKNKNKALNDEGGKTTSGSSWVRRLTSRRNKQTKTVGKEGVEKMDDVTVTDHETVKSTSDGDEYETPAEVDEYDFDSSVVNNNNHSTSTASNEILYKVTTASSKGAIEPQQQQNKMKEQKK